VRSKVQRGKGTEAQSRKEQAEVRRLKFEVTKSLQSKNLQPIKRTGNSRFGSWEE